MERSGNTSTNTGRVAGIQGVDLMHLCLLPAVLISPEFVVVSVSPAAAASLSARVGSTLGDLAGKLHAPRPGEEPDIAFLESMAAEVFRSGDQATTDVVDEQGKWHALTLHPCNDEKGETYAVLMLLIDIHERKREEEKSAYMAAIVTSSDDAIISKDLNGIIHSWNAAAERLYGYTAAEAIGKPVAMLIPSDQADEEPEILRRIRSGEMIDHYETVRLHKDGRLIHVSLTVSPVKDFSGKIVGAAKIARDITERKRAEEVLRESEERFRTIADHAPVLIWINNRTEFEFANRTYLTFLGATMDEIRGDGWQKFVHPEDRERYISQYLSAMSRVANFESDFRFLRHDGEYRWMKSVGAPWIAPSGELLGYIGSTVDISDRKEDELRLLQAQKLESMGVLAGGIAHDFNNLLTGILGASNLLAETEGMPEAAAPLLNGIATACARAADLTRQILAYAGKGRFVIEPIDVSALAHEMAELLRASVPKNVTIIESLTDKPGLVMGDRGQLQQVIMNLVLNATESLEGRPGKVRISSNIRHYDEGQLKTGLVPAEGDPGEYLHFKVSDEGTGMDDKVLARIFDPFFSTKSRGRGLGLSAVLGIVRGHKGGLSVQSEPGKGTTFDVILPILARADTEETDNTTNRSVVLSNGPGTMLVVDDEEMVRTVVANALSREGYHVVTADDGLQGVERYVEHAGQLVGVFLDLTMPTMNGDDALKKMREIRADVPVIVMSGYSENEVSERFGADEFLTFLQKPFTVDALKRSLHSLVG